jgi:hypothetical protein
MANSLACTHRLYFIASASRDSVSAGCYFGEFTSPALCRQGGAELKGGFQEISKYLEKYF